MSSLRVHRRRPHPSIAPPLDENDDHRRNVDRPVYARRPNRRRVRGTSLRAVMTLPRRATGRGVRAYSARVTRVARAVVMCCAHRRGRSGRPETRQSSKRATSRRGRRAGLGCATTATRSPDASPARMSAQRRGAAHPSSSSTNDGGGGTILHRTTRAPTRPMRAARCRPGFTFWGVLIALLTVV